MLNNTTPKKLIRITTVPMSLRYLLPGQMNFMKENGYDVLMISADGKELEEVISNEKCRHQVVPMTRSITPFQDLKCLIQLIRIFRRERPDIVHSHTPKAGLLGMIAAKLCGVKTRVHTVAGLPMMVQTGLKFQVLKSIEKLTYAAANHVWPNSVSLLRYISQHNLTSHDKLNIIARGSSNGINTEKFNAASLNPETLATIKSAINHDKTNTYLLCMGRLVKDKGIVELVNVFNGLQKTDTKLRLILVGEFEAALDSLPAETLTLIENHPAIIHVRWTKDVEYYMHLADNFIFPSHREGFPNVLLQAAAMNLPIICSKIMGNVDIVQDNRTGLIFETGNEQQMQSLISTALQQRDRMKLMAKNLQEMICREYPRNYIWQKILHQYEVIQLPAPTPYRPFHNMLQMIQDIWRHSGSVLEESTLQLQGRRR
ncbi:MAG: capsule biosynthesis protein CapM [Ferruginibacter sp.]|nr:capsule biosynthesis protein CapM [Ferruginibacter sp.]